MTNRKLIGYFYTGEILDAEGDVELDDLLNTLGLANYLDAKGLIGLAQHEIIARKLVDPFSLDTGTCQLETLPKLGVLSNCFTNSPRVRFRARS